MYQITPFYNNISVGGLGLYPQTTLTISVWISPQTDDIKWNQYIINMTKNGLIIKAILNI